jgi:type IV secretory pathway VirB10-like protein
MSVAIKSFPPASVRWTLGCTLAAVLVNSFVVLGSATAVRAAEDDEAEDTIDTKFMRNFLTNLGLRQGNEPGIDYHERSPLVVPPTRDLPKPEISGGATANPAWPKDPDVQRQKKVKRERKGTTQAEQEDMRQLRPDELAAQRSRTASTSAASGPVPNPDATRASQMSPNQLGFTGFNWSWKGFWDKEGTSVPFVKEPERTTLTDPPPGLRTPSPKYQYGSKNKLEPTREIGTDTAVGAK